MRFKALQAFVVFGVTAAAQERASSDLARDMAAIAQLHKIDADAAKVGDVDKLGTLWTADAVALPPGEQPIVGIDAIRTWLDKTRMDTTKVEITEYEMDFKEIRVFGDQAFERARTSITIRPKGAPSGMHASGNLMRLLRRQPDGTWRVARAIWNMEKPSPESAVVSK